MLIFIPDTSISFSFVKSAILLIKTSKQKGCQVLQAVNSFSSKRKQERKQEKYECVFPGAYSWRAKLVK
jgi:hypothetical protein